MNTDLVQFIRARLDEEAEAAEAADKQEVSWRWDPDAESPVERHIARYDPVRVLAEVYVKRRIVAEHDTFRWEIGDRVHDCQWVPEWPCTTLRLLALPYVTHPDFLVEWVPDLE